MTKIQAELFGHNGIATETIGHANLVSFTSLEVIRSSSERNDRKDAHDLIYCIEQPSEGLAAVSHAFREERNGKHAVVIQSALEILRKRFAHDKSLEGYRKDGPDAARG